MGRKKLRGVAAGVLGSFVGRNNDVDGYWALGLLRSECEEHNATALSLDLLAGTASIEAEVPSLPIERLGTSRSIAGRVASHVATAYHEVLARLLRGIGLGPLDLRSACVLVDFAPKSSTRIEGEVPRLPIEGEVPRLPIEGEVPRLPIEGEVPRLPIEGEVPRLPIEGEVPRLPIEGEVPRLPIEGERPSPSAKGEVPTGIDANASYGDLFVCLVELRDDRGRTYRVLYAGRCAAHNPREEHRSNRAF